MKRPRKPSSPLADAQAEVLARFDRLIAQSLGPILGKSNLAKVRTDLAIVTNVAGGVVVHAGLKGKRPMTLARIAKEKPIVGVLANSFPLTDPVTRAVLKPGAYVVRLRRVGEGAMAFDLFDKRSLPVLSVSADPTHALPPDHSISILGIVDVDLDWPWDPDSMKPPVDNGAGKLCLSFLIWKHCWSWDWPDIDWPWDI